MKRDIKFRGIGKADKKWIYGDLRLGGVYKESPAIIDHRLGTDDDDKLSSSPYVYLETIGAYTGLKDANGIDIYEHDIIKCDNFTIEVAYNEKRGSFCPLIRRDGKEEICPVSIGTVLKNEKNAIVIGNRFNNSQLELPINDELKEKIGCFTTDDIRQGMSYLGFDQEQIANVINRLKSKSQDKTPHLVKDGKIF